MDRKSKILSMVLKEKDNNRQCIDFVAVPNHEGKGTDKNERHLLIQGQHKLLAYEYPNKHSHPKTPLTGVQLQVNNISSTEKIYKTRLLTIKKKLFEEEKSLDQHQSSEYPESQIVTTTLKEVDDNDNNYEDDSSGSELIPDSSSNDSGSESESGDSFSKKLEKICNNKLEIISDVLIKSTEPSTSVDIAAIIGVDKNPNDFGINKLDGQVCNGKKKMDSDVLISESTEPSISVDKAAIKGVEKNTNDFGIYKLDGQVRNGKKKVDFCFYCETLVLNFARHIARNHPSELDVQKILSKLPGSKERKFLLDLLRKKGNFINSNVARKPVQSLRSAKNILPCDNCLGFFSAKLLWRHRIKCTNLKSKDHKAVAQNLLLANLRVDQKLKDTVFPRMRADEISLVAKMDPIICAYGARYIKIHREAHFINVASRKMRELSRLLIELRKIEPTIKCLFDALKPKYFDTLVVATKIVAKYNTEKDKFESPTYAMNMGTYLKQCAEIAIVFALKRKEIAETVISAEAEADLKTLIKVIESQWQYDI